MRSETNTTEEARTVPALLRHAAARWGSQEAAVDATDRLTFSELHERAQRGARALRARGLGDGDPVAIWAPNSVNWVVAALSVHCAGGIVVPLNSRLRGFEVLEAVEDCQAAMLVLEDRAIGKNFTTLLAEAQWEREREWDGLTVYLDDGPEGHASARHLTWRQLLDDGASSESDALPVVGADQTADILFTSGTTGRPKGVAMTHRQVSELARSWATRVGVDNHDRYLVLSPLSHTFGYKTGLLACLAAGATMITTPTADPPTVAGLLTRERITILPGVPTALSDLMDAPDLAPPDDLFIRVAVTGAAPCAPELIERMGTRFGAAAVISAYGLTEAGPVTMCGLDELITDIAHTTGRPLDGVAIHTRGTDGTPTRPGVAGEICVRSRFLMQGYWDAATQTAVSDLDDEWLATGDIGVIDDRGYLTIVDRLKDVIQVGGFSVYPAEIERVLQALPDVLDAAVAAHHDPRLGEVPVAYIVPATTDTKAENIIDRCRRRLANYKVPRHVYFVKALPRNATGKLLRSQIGNTTRTTREDNN